VLPAAILPAELFGLVFVLGVTAGADRALAGTPAVYMAGFAFEIGMESVRGAFGLAVLPYSRGKVFVALYTSGPVPNRAVGRAGGMTFTASQFFVKSTQGISGLLMLEVFFSDPGGSQGIFPRAVFDMAGCASFFGGMTMNAAVDHQFHLDFAFETAFIRGSAETRMALVALLFDRGVIPAHRARHQPRAVCGGYADDTYDDEKRPEEFSHIVCGLFVHD
jgi:hypothetical protein